MQAAPSTPIHFESAWIAHANSFQLLPLMAKGNERVQSRAKLWGYGLGKETYMQHELVVRGTTHVPHSDTSLNLAVFWAGALWRRYRQPLCTALGRSPSNESRTCSHRVGAFHARIWVVGPPLEWPPALGQGRNENSLRGALATLRAFDVCAIELSPTIRALCRERGRLTLPELMTDKNVTTQTRQNMFPSDWEPMGAAFILAAQSLPQPFTVLESGNLCGGATAFFSALRKRFCPSCQVLSRDPGIGRLAFGGNSANAKQLFDCARHTLDFFGLAEGVEMVDTVTIAAEGRRRDTCWLCFHRRRRRAAPAWSTRL